MATIQKGQILREDFNNWDGITKTDSRVDSTGGTITGNKIGDAVDVLMVYGGGTDYTSTTINNAIAALSTTPIDLLFATGTWNITANVTIPATMNVIIPAGCTFNISAGITLTINGFVFTSNAVINSGTGTITYGKDLLNPPYYKLLADETSAGVTPINYYYEWGHPFRYGAAGDGVTDDTTALQASIDYLSYINGKGSWPRKNFVITSPLTISDPLALDGNMCQIFQSTADTDGLVVDKGTAVLATNLQNTLVIENIIMGTEAGTGNAFVFRNMNESNVRNLFVPYVGDIGFRFQGCILTLVEHCYVGDGLRAEPGFFKSAGLTSSTTGFITESYNGTGSNDNTFLRCTATNSTSRGFNISGVANVLINSDAEGITSPAVGVELNGIGGSVIGGDFEGSGYSISIKANGATVKGVNALGPVVVDAAATGASIIGGQIKYLTFSGDNNFASGVTIIAGGVLTNTGQDNYLINIYDTDTATDKGYYRSGTFTPDLEFGGSSGVSAYSALTATWWRNGNIVFFSIYIRPNTYTAATGTATINMNDIPYTPKSGSENIPCNIRWNGVPAGAGYIIEANVQPGAKTINLERILDTSGAVSVLDETFFSSLDQFKIGGWFPIA